MQRMPAVSRPGWASALSGLGVGGRRSPIEIVATMGTYMTRTQAAEWSGLRAGPFGRWAEGVTAMREDCAAFASHWQAHNERVLGRYSAGQFGAEACESGPLWAVLGDSTAQGLGAPAPEAGYAHGMLGSRRPGQRALRGPDQPDHPRGGRRPGPARRRGIRALHAALDREVRVRLLPPEPGRLPRLDPCAARRDLRLADPGPAALARADMTGRPVGWPVTLPPWPG
jgi:hypothetical protein